MKLLMNITKSECLNRIGRCLWEFYMDSKMLLELPSTKWILKSKKAFNFRSKNSQKLMDPFCV